MGNYKRYFFLHLLCITLLLSSLISITSVGSAKDNEIDLPWHKDWKYHQEIILPIETKNMQARYQPIDMHLSFQYPCWGINDSYHSIRVCSWNSSEWNELEIQIYNIEKTDETTVSSCNIVFIIPPYANGDESYYVFYDDKKKQPPSYQDHVQLLDKYYYFEPISGISVEGDYYEIREDDIIVYGVGQKGRVINRQLSQIAIKMKPDTKKFDMLATDLLTSFCFSYQKGVKETDEVASDQDLISKKVLVDGNLMCRFRITSKSENDVLFTSNVYTYYYQPGEDKRISVNVHHEVKQDVSIKGIKNCDGRFGAIISYHSKSANVEKMVFGDILPNLYVAGDTGFYDYALDDDPENSQQEWIISYQDDCDLGADAWLAYGDEESGLTHGLLFSSHKGIVQNATDTHDGIEIKLAEKEYLDVIGAEVDYASIGFGRNAFEEESGHIDHIEKGLNVTFDVEFYSTYSGGYKRIEEESKFFKKLVQLRDVTIRKGTAETNIFTLTVIPHLFGRIGSYPRLRNVTSISFPVLKAELYQNETFIAEHNIDKPLVGFQSVRFPKLSAGYYYVKMYRVGWNDKKKYIGFGAINLSSDSTLHIYCTWQQEILVSIHNQFDHGVSQVSLEVYQGPHIITSIDSQSLPENKIPVPFSLFKSYSISEEKNLSINDLFQQAEPYELRTYYKGFTFFNSTLNRFFPQAEISLSTYDVMIEISDLLGFPPGVDIIPEITSDEMTYKQPIHPSESFESGNFQFRKIPEASYTVHVSFGGYSTQKSFRVPESGERIPIQFLATQSLSIDVLTHRGESINPTEAMARIIRNGEEITYQPTSKKINLPPGRYVVSIIQDEKIIGFDVIELKSDKSISIITTLPSLVNSIITFTAIILFAEIILFFYFGKISLNTALKLVILGVVLFGLMQPWWTFYGESEDESVVKKSEMFLYPATMIETYQVNDNTYFSLATIPEIFTNFIQYLLLIIVTGIGLLLASFIPNILLKKRYSFALSASGIIFMLLVSAAFFFGMNQIAQLSLGSLQGEGMLTVTPPYNEEIIVSASWGLGPGFIIVFFGAFIAVVTGILDFIKKRYFDNKKK